MINAEDKIRKDQSVRREKLAGFRRQAKAIENFFIASGGLIAHKIRILPPQASHFRTSKPKTRL
jgi:hypothetical protein